VFNQDGDLERCALRPGNVHSAHGWRDVLDPVVARYRGQALRRLLRGDAAFALPDVYEYLEAEGFQYTIRPPLRPRATAAGFLPGCASAIRSICLRWFSRRRSIGPRFFTRVGPSFLSDRRRSHVPGPFPCARRPLPRCAAGARRRLRRRSNRRHRECDRLYRGPQRLLQPPLLVLGHSWLENRGGLTQGTGT
jgi:hypothetical protein